MSENQQENNISPEQQKSLIEARKARLKEMGLPIPMAPITPPNSANITNVKNPDVLSKIRQIQSGKLKQEFKKIDEKSSSKLPGFVELPAPKSQNNNRQLEESNHQKVHVPLEEFSAKRDPQIESLGNVFDFDSNSSRSSYGQSPSNTSEDTGSKFLNDFKGDLHKRLQDKQNNAINSNVQQQNVNLNEGQTIPFQSGMIILNEEDLKRKIISIAKPIAKQVAAEMIKEVLSEYAKRTSKPVVTETKQQKIEILSDNKVKINGKIFKLSADK